jgi:hypothetical protein
MHHLVSIYYLITDVREARKEFLRIVLESRNGSHGHETLSE